MKQLLSTILCLALLFSSAGSIGTEGNSQEYIVEYVIAAAQNKLSADDYLYMCMALRIEEINLKNYNLPWEEFKSGLNKFILDNPELLVLRWKSLSYSNDGFVTRLCVTYLSDELDEHISGSKFVDKKITDLAIYSSQYDDKKIQLTLLHDKICRDYEYDYEKSDISRRAYSVLKYKKGTCQGFSSLYNSVLNQMGFETAYVRSNELNHVWSAVKLDGEWFYTDVTWDVELSSDTAAKRKYFLLNKDEFEASHGSEDTWEWITD